MDEQPLDLSMKRFSMERKLKPKSNLELLSKMSIFLKHPKALQHLTPEKLRKIQNYKNILICETCFKFFDRPSLLLRHIRSHTGAKPFQCSTCQKAFSTSSSLNTHSRIHTGSKPFKCSICQKSFTASSNLYYHRMIHFQNKPHKCTMFQCSRSFSTPGDLRNHSYTHSGQWPFNCNTCQKGFAKRTSFQNHLSTQRH